MPTKEIQGAVSVINDNVQYTGSLQVNAGAAATGFCIADPTDSSKKMIFDISGLATGTTDTFTPSPGGAEVTVDGTQTLTNKTLDGDDNTITDLAVTALKTVLAAALTFISRDAAGIPISTKVVPTGTVVGTTDSQTLTNKILTAPTINAATLTGAINGGTVAPTTLTVPASTSLTTPTIAGATLSGTMTGGTLAPTTLTVPASTALTTPALTAPTVATSLVITSTTGALILPRMTTTQRDALTPLAGMLIYNTSTAKLNVYTTAWEVIVSA